MDEGTKSVIRVGVDGYEKASELADSLAETVNGYVEPIKNAVGAALEPLDPVLQPAEAAWDKVSGAFNWVDDRVKGWVKDLLEITGLLDLLEKVVGKPDELTAAARIWQEQAKEIHQIIGDIGTGMKQLGPEWKGEAAAAFAAFMGKSVKELGDMATDMQKVAKILIDAAKAAQMAEDLLVEIIVQFIEFAAISLLASLLTSLVTLGISMAAEAAALEVDAIAAGARGIQVSAKLAQVLQKIAQALREIQKVMQTAREVGGAFKTFKFLGRGREALKAGDMAEAARLLAGRHAYAGIKGGIAGALGSGNPITGAASAVNNSGDYGTDQGGKPESGVDVIVDNLDNATDDEPPPSWDVGSPDGLSNLLSGDDDWARQGPQQRRPQ